MTVYKKRKDPVFIAGFDVDETVNDLIEHLIPFYNDKYNDDLEFSQITDYGIQQFIKPECENFLNEFSTPRNIESMSIREGFEDLLNWCYEQKYMFPLFITASHVDTINCKFLWLQDKFEWCTNDHIVRLKQKYLLQNVNTLADDYYENLIYTDTCRILMHKPWNKDIDDRKFDLHRAYNANEVKRYIKTEYEDWLIKNDLI